MLWLTLALSGSLWLSLARCPALSGSLWLSVWLSLALSGSLWLPLALSGSLWLSIALQICLPSPCSAHKALAQLGTPFLRSLTLISPDIKYVLHIFLLAVKIRLTESTLAHLLRSLKTNKKNCSQEAKMLPNSENLHLGKNIILNFRQAAKISGQIQNKMFLLKG